MTSPQPASVAPTGSLRDRPSRRRWRRALPYVGAVLIIGLLVLGLWPRPASVETAVVERGLLRASINEEGKTRLRSRYVVHAPIPGQLQRMPWKAGHDVRADETIVARIDPLPPLLLDARAATLARARVDTATAQLEKAKANLEFAQSERRRATALSAQKAVSPQELESAEWRATAAERELASAESTLRQAETELMEFHRGTAAKPGASVSPLEIRSPVTGRVLRVFEENARSVTTGTPLLELGDPSDLEVVIEVLSRDGAMIRPGMPVELDQWGGPKPLEARVRMVEPGAFTKISALGVEEQRVNVVADLLTPPDQRAGLGDRFRVESRIIVWEDSQAVKVPSGALFRRGNDWHAFVVEQGRARLRGVTVGRASTSETQILNGLSEGETVIVYPGDRIREGSRVRVIVL